MSDSATNENLREGRGERGDFGKDQGSPVKTSSSALSAPPRESSAGPILQKTNLSTKFSS